MENITREVYVHTPFRGYGNFGNFGHNNNFGHGRANRSELELLIDDQLADQAAQGGSLVPLGKEKSGTGNGASGGRRSNIDDLQDGFTRGDIWADFGMGENYADMAESHAQGHDTSLTIDPASGCIFANSGEQVGFLTEDEVADLLDAESYKEEVLDVLTNLENDDKSLLEIIRRSRDLMSENGQMSLATNGL